MTKKYIIKDILNVILNNDESINLDFFDCGIIKNKNIIIRYLRNGYEVSSVSTAKECEICNKPVGSTLYLSDGYWIWPKWLIHYVQEHNMKLPNDFLIHIESKDFEIDQRLVKKIIENENTEIA
ncbi:hypothetical protein [Olleya sp. ITB9]|uniref:hypothetical protein n=1 Tax=Olleya sp. ITB9 TaxID=1715648 RepID=UPI0006CFA8B8|nr:hypothetical protein [Olleya sp. ITB9]